jgi:hypothetical protein
MTDAWATEERARCLTELAALKQGASIHFDEGSGAIDITEYHSARLAKWVEVLDAMIENDQRLPDQDHVDQGDRGETTD